jgi:hypothetical protein
MPESPSPKQDHERYLVQHLCLEALGKEITTLIQQDRPDVLVEFDGMRVGIEVTVFHADEGINGKGSLIRMEEQIAAGRARARGGAYQLYVPDMDPTAALASRVKDKCGNFGLKTSSIDELWLLVAGGLVDDIGRLAATGVDPKRLQVSELNKLTHDALTASEFDRAYFDVHSWGSLYRWTRSGKWKAAKCASSPRMAQVHPPRMTEPRPRVFAAIGLGAVSGLVLGACVYMALQFSGGARAVEFGGLLGLGLCFFSACGLAGGLWAWAIRRRPRL